MTFEDLNIGMSLSAIVGSMLAAGLIAAVCIFLIFSAFALFFYTIAMMMGAKVVNIEDRTFGKALTATALNLFLGWMIVGVLLFIFPPLAIAAYFLLPCVFIKWIYECTYGKALLAAILSYFAAIALGLLLFIVALVAFKLTPNNKEKKEEKISKVEINKRSESPIVTIDEKLTVIEKIPVKKALSAKAPIKEPKSIKLATKTTTPKKPQKKIQQVRPLTKSKKKPDVKIASNPKVKLKLANKNSAIVNLAKQ